MIPLTVKKQEVELAVIRKVNQTGFSNLSAFRLVDRTKFLEKVTSFVSVVIAYRTTGVRNCSPRLVSAVQKNWTVLESSFVKLSLTNLGTRISMIFFHIFGVFERETLQPRKHFLNWNWITRFHVDERNYKFSLNVWEYWNACTTKIFSRWYFSKDLVPTLNALQKREKIEFYRIKEQTCWNSDAFCQTEFFSLFTSQRSLVFVHLKNAKQVCLRKYVKTWLVVYPLC